MDMSSYRLSFINSLGLPTPSPPSRYRRGTFEECRIAQGERTNRMYLALLAKAGVDYTMHRDGHITMGDKVEMDLVAQLWNDAQLLVTCGRDLH